MTYRALSRLVVLTGLAALFLAPYAYMLAFSVKPASEIFTGSLSLLPTSFDGFANYSNVLTRRPLLLYLANGRNV